MCFSCKLFFLIYEGNIHLITEGIVCKDATLGEVEGSGIIEDGKISQWQFEDFPETPEDLRFKISNAILGK